MNPPLSICIPTYNRAKYLADTLESIVRQKEFGEIEVVVSDNCSSDRTRDVALEYANQFPENIVYSRNETNLLDGNFPKALSLGRGEFLKLLNDTAPLRPGALERMLATIRRAKKHDKTLPFFINGNARGTEHILCGSLDEFIDKTRYYNTWIATFGVWREILPDVLPILRSTVASKLTQSWALLTLVSRGWNVLVDPAVVFDSVTPSKKGGYNIAEVFGHNYNVILEEFRNRSNLSNRTYKKAKRDILPFVNAYYFDPKKEFAFDKTGYFKWMLPFYRWDPAFYAKWLSMQRKRLTYALKRRRPKDAPDKA